MDPRDRSDRRAAPPRADRPEHRRGRTARPPRRRAGHLLLRIRPDGAEPARREPGPVHAAPRAAAGRPPAGRPRRGRHRADRGPRGPELRAAAQRPRGGRRVGRADPPERAAAPRAPGRGAGAAGADLRGQPGLDRAALGHRLPARHRQELPCQSDAGQGGGVGTAELRGGHQLHRVQLPDPAGQRLPGALPAARGDAADRRLRSVGQPDRRDRSGPPHRKCKRARHGHPAHHHRRRPEDRQDARAPRCGWTPS